VLVVWGDKDGLIPVSAAYEFEQRIPRAELAIFENVGHVPMEEVPAESAAAVRAFLSKGLAEVSLPESIAAE